MQFFIYLVFIISFFMRLPKRIPVLGVIRLDLILIAVLCFFVILNLLKDKAILKNKIVSYLIIFVLYVIVTTPLVQYVGSVVRKNMLEYFAVLMFFFCTVSFIKTERQLKIFMTVFLMCNIFRVMEPLMLHITTGYWGSATNVEGELFTNRLSGAPADIINPNGLAQVITINVAFLFFLTKDTAFRSFFYVLLVPFIYALVLTQSRSGMIGFIIVILGIALYSKKKIIYVLLTPPLLMYGFTKMGAIYQNRYLSMFESDVGGSATFTRRIDAWFESLKVVAHAPFVGHGIGTSYEARANILNSVHVEHNMYLEILIEVGILGFILYMLYLLKVCKQLFSKLDVDRIKEGSKYAYNLICSLRVIVVYMLIFNMASFGLNVYHWYLLGGLTAAAMSITDNETVK